MPPLVKAVTGAWWRFRGVRQIKNCRFCLWENALRRYTIGLGANAKSKTMAPFEYRIPRARSARRISCHLRQLLPRAFPFLPRLPHP